MHGRTFQARIIGLKATVWDDSAHRGRCGTIKSRSGVGRKGKGTVDITFPDGGTHTAPFDRVALGDNSHAESSS